MTLQSNLVSEMVEDSLTKGSSLTNEERARITGDLLEAKDKMVSLHLDIESIRKDLENKEKEFKKLSEGLVPFLMDQLGESQLPISSEAYIEINEPLYCGITKTNQEEAHLWLEENGHASVISDVISMKFDKGLKQDADDAAKKMKECGLKFDRDQKVNANTLKALLKREIAKGSNVPFDLFSVYIPKIAEIRFKKK